MKLSANVYACIRYDLISVTKGEYKIYHFTLTRIQKADTSTKSLEIKMKLNKWNVGHNQNEKRCGKDLVVENLITGTTHWRAHTFTTASKRFRQCCVWVWVQSAINGTTKRRKGENGRAFWWNASIRLQIDLNDDDVGQMKKDGAIRETQMRQKVLKWPNADKMHSLREREREMTKCTKYKEKNHNECVCEWWKAEPYKLNDIWFMRRWNEPKAPEKEQIRKWW